MFPTVKYAHPISTSAMSVSPLQTSKPFNPYSANGHLSPLTQDKTQFSVGLTPTQYLLGVNDADPLRYVLRRKLTHDETKVLKASGRKSPTLGVHVYRDKVYTYRKDVLQPLLNEGSVYFSSRIRHWMKLPSRYIQAVFVSHQAGVSSPFSKKKKTIHFHKGYADALNFKNKNRQERVQTIREAMTTFRHYDNRNWATLGVEGAVLGAEGAGIAVSV